MLTNLTAEHHWECDVGGKVKSPLSLLCSLVGEGEKSGKALVDFSSIVTRSTVQDI